MDFYQNYDFALFEKIGFSRGFTTGVEQERDEAKAEVQVAQLAAIEAGDMKARAEEELTRVRDALAAVEEARRKAKVEASRMVV